MNARSAALKSNLPPPPPSHWWGTCRLGWLPRARMAPLDLQLVQLVNPQLAKCATWQQVCESRYRLGPHDAGTCRSSPETGTCR